MALPQRTKLNRFLHFLTMEPPYGRFECRSPPGRSGSRLELLGPTLRRANPSAWQFGPVMVADHRRDDSMAGLARRILADAPPRFALAGLSMGGYIAFEILRQAASRVAKLALLDTGAGAEVSERTAQRKPLIALAQGGRFAEITDDQFPLLVHRSRHGEAALKAAVRAMNEETGPDAYCRQQH